MKLMYRLYINFKYKVDDSLKLIAIFLCLNLRRNIKMKIWKEEQLNLLEGYPREAVNSVNETIGILNDNYGVDRDVDKNLGGYIQVIESLEESP